MSNDSSNRQCVIAVDGPAGAGKSTVARAVAAHLGYIYVDTGAMYRALTLLTLRRGVSPDDGAALADLMKRADMRLTPQKLGVPNQVYLDGEDVTEQIRQPEVSQLVSQVASHALLRRYMVEMQRQMAKNGGVVMDGRDIGTVVLPHADVKVFLVADVNVRAQRRWEELRANGHNVSQEQVRDELEARDFKDRTRRESPLRKADDAVEIDTSGKSVEQVVEEILALCR